MESTISKDSAQKLGEDENIIKGGHQLHEATSTEFSHGRNAANYVDEGHPCLASSSPETNLRRPSTKNVADYKIFKLHEINELEASGDNEVPVEYVLDLSTSSTSFRLPDHSLTDHIHPEPKSGTSDKKLNSQDSPSATMRYLETLKPHECETCKKRFRWRAELMQHQLVHTADRPYECKTCKNTFKFPSHLIRHERIHTGERPYKCEICKKGFPRKFVLKTHLLTHTGERPFECEICHQKFKRKYHLTKHGRVHKKKQPY